MRQPYALDRYSLLVMGRLLDSCPTLLLTAAEAVQAVSAICTHLVAVGSTEWPLKVERAATFCRYVDAKPGHRSRHASFCFSWVTAVMQDVVIKPKQLTHDTCDTRGSVVGLIRIHFYIFLYHVFTPSTGG